MKLLFDQNLSFKLRASLADLFPGSEQVGRIGLAEATDLDIWRYAKTNGFALVSQDADFAEIALHYGSPPKVIWLRCGNQRTAVLADILRRGATAILAFEADAETGCLEIY